MTQCGTQYFFAGASVLNPGGYISTQYTDLPSHDIIYFSINFALYDSVDQSDYITINFDLVQFQTRTTLLATDYTNIVLTSVTPCGNGNQGAFFTFEGKAFHSASTLTLKLTSGFNEAASNENFGIREISILFLNSSAGETTSMCLHMDDLHFTETSNLCPCNEGQYSSSSTCPYCDQSCESCLGPTSSECLNCRPTFFWNGTDCTCRSDQSAVAGVCLDCDATCSTCYGPAPAQCNQCFQGRYLNGTSCFTCDPSCVACNGGANNQCTKCKSGEYLDSGMCKPCDSACAECFGGDNQECYSCNSGYYFLSPSACIANCISPLTSSMTNGVLTCSYGCAALQFLYPNQSCSSICETPFTAATMYQKQFCQSPCLGTTTDVLDIYGECSTDCVYPMKSLNTSNGPICSPSCPDGGYLYQDSQCLSSCDSPLQAYEYAGYKMCAAPLCYPDGDDSNTTASGQHIPRSETCPDNYGCASSGLCVPIVSNQLNAEWVMTLTNGYLLSVNVVRTVELMPELDDKLQMKIQDLVEGVDYSAKFKNTAVGNFQVTITLLRSVSVDPLKVSFLYSPLRLKLTASLSLTRVTFINPAILEAAKNLETSSQGIFTVMAASSVGFTIIGKLGNMWSFLAINQYMHHLLYLKVTYLPHTIQYLRSLANYNIILLKMSYDMTTDIRQMRDLRLGLPARFMDEKYAPDLFINTAQILGIVGVMISVLAIATTMIVWKEKPPKIAMKAQATIKWNGLFRQLLTYCLPLSVACLIQLHFSLFSGNETSRINIFTAFLVLLGIVLGMARAFPLINDIPTKQFRRVVHLTKYGSLYLGLNQKSRTRHYFWFIALRGLLLAYLVVFFEYFPTAQVVILVVYQLFVIRLFTNGRKLHLVFQDPVTNVLSLATELLLLLKKIVIILVLEITPKTSNASLLINLGWGIIAPGILIQLIQVGYAVYIQYKYRKKIVSALRALMNKLCGKKKRRKINRVWPPPPHLPVGNTTIQNHHHETSMNMSFNRSNTNMMNMMMNASTPSTNSSGLSHLSSNVSNFSNYVDARDTRDARDVRSNQRPLQPLPPSKSMFMKNQR